MSCSARGQRFCTGNGRSGSIASIPLLPDSYDAQRVLQQVVLDVKEAKSLEEVTGEVVKQIHGALHPEFVSLLHRQEDQLELRRVGCAPADHRSPEILVSRKVTAFLRLVEKPVQRSASSLVTEALRGEENVNRRT